MTTNVNHPYFSPNEVAFLCERQRGKMAESQEGKLRLHACAFIEAVSSKIGFPRATIATAQTLFHRFYLFYPWKAFNYHDVAMATLYVSSKMHDTLKKPRDLLMVSYGVRYPELAAKVKHGGGEVEMDPATVDEDRRRLLGIERSVMETICFNFRVRLPFSYVVKVARELKVGKQLTKLAWRLSIDSHRTLAPLQYPPHVLALASILLAALLDSREGPFSAKTTEDQRSCHEIAALLGHKGSWEDRFHAQVEDLEEVCHTILDLLLSAASTTTVATTSPQTPNTPTSPSSYSSYHTPGHTSASTSSGMARVLQVQPLYTSAQLTQLKIFLRERPHPYPPRDRGPIPGRDNSLFFQEPKTQNGEEESAQSISGGTVRFLFGPEL